jgi:hypothetical protein
MFVTYSYNVISGVTAIMKEELKEDEYKIFRTLRHMVDDMGVDDTEFEFSLTSDDTPIHQNTYAFIKELCAYLTDNSINADNWEDYMASRQDYMSSRQVDINIADNMLGDYLEVLFDKYSVASIDEDRHNLFKCLLIVSNYTAIDNGCDHDTCFVLNLLCAHYAHEIISKSTEIP